MTSGERLAPTLALALVTLLACGAGRARAQEPAPAPVPDGPVLVATHAGDGFGLYAAEILRTEGLAALRVEDVAALDAAELARHAVVVLTAGPVTEGQAALLRAYVARGGNVVALRPDASLAGLFGLRPRGATLSDAYYSVDVSAPPGAGIEARPMQFHGTADGCDATPGTRVVATLRGARDDAGTDAMPALVVRGAASARGGHAAAFTFDVARSVAWTRQGNPAWAGQERDGAVPMRPDDLFFPDWVDLENLAIPQADELARLFVHVILEVTAARLPLPRFAYLPDALPAAVVLTADDHGSRNGVARRVGALVATRTPGCSLLDWSCTSATSYLSATTSLTVAQAAEVRAQGFELGVHVDTLCRDWAPDALDAVFERQLAAFAARFPGAPAPRTNRTHCIVWSDWTTQPAVELAHGIRLDTNYYHWPGSWLHDRGGLFTGSALPMRFAARDGTPLDVYQATTQLTDESGQAYPSAVDALLDRATGPEGAVGVFVANLHTDTDDDTAALALVDSATRHRVPVISAAQLLAWLDARDAAAFRDLAFAGHALAFRVEAGGAAERLVARLPAARGTETLVSLTRDGAPVATTAETDHGLATFRFAAGPGAYVATYARTPPRARAGR